MKILKMAHLQPNTTHHLDLKGQFGEYRVIIGPLPQNKKFPIPVEIIGEIHHLCISPNSVMPNPSKKDIENHLKDCSILNDITVHFEDSIGNFDGVLERRVVNQVHPKSEINFCGEEGKKRVHQMTTTGLLAQETYNIIQEDILKRLVGSVEK